jgi:hypothetical protein
LTGDRHDNLNSAVAARAHYPLGRSLQHSAHIPRGRGGLFTLVKGFSEGLPPRKRAYRRQNTCCSRPSYRHAGRPELWQSPTWRWT